MLRSWPALFAWGAGLIHLAVGAGVRTASDPVTAGILALLLVLGAAELAWGVDALRMGSPRAPRAAAGAAVGAAVLGGCAIAVGASPIAIAAASGLAVAAGAISAARPGRTRRPAGRGAQVAAIALAAVLVAGIATPALATTDAARYAVPHGEHGTLVDPHAGH